MQEHCFSFKQAFTWYSMLFGVFSSGRVQNMKHYSLFVRFSYCLSRVHLISCWPFSWFSKRPWSSMENKIVMINNTLKIRAKSLYTVLIFWMTYSYLELLFTTAFSKLSSVWKTHLNNRLTRSSKGIPRRSDCKPSRMIKIRLNLCQSIINKRPLNMEASMPTSFSRTNGNSLKSFLIKGAHRWRNPRAKR